MSLFLSRTFHQQHGPGLPDALPVGKVPVRDAVEGRRLARRLESAGPESASRLTASALLEDAYQSLLRQHLVRQDPTLIDRILATLRAQLGTELLDLLLLEFAEEYLGAQLSGLSLSVDGNAGDLGGELDRAEVVQQILVFWLLQSDPAASTVITRLDRAPLLEVPAFRELVDHIRRLLDRESSGDAGAGVSLWRQLTRPQRRAPDSLTGQLAFVREHWAPHLGVVGERLESFLTRSARGLQTPPARQSRPENQSTESGSAEPLLDPGWALGPAGSRPGRGWRSLHLALRQALEENLLRRMMHRAGKASPLAEDDGLFEASTAAIESVARAAGVAVAPICRQRLLALLTLPELASRLTASRRVEGPREGHALEQALQRRPESVPMLFCWLVVGTIGDLVAAFEDPSDPDRGRDLESVLWSSLIAAGGEAETLGRLIDLLRESLRVGWGRRAVTAPGSVELQRELLSDPGLRRALGAHDFQGQEYLDRSSLEALIDWRLLSETLAWSAAGRDAAVLVKKVGGWWRVLGRLARDAEASAYQTSGLRFGASLAEG